MKLLEMAHGWLALVDGDAALVPFDLNEKAANLENGTGRP